MDKITITNAKNCKLDGGVRTPPTYMSFSNDEDNVPAELTVEVSSLDDVSDGYHTIAELYHHRVTLYIALCRTLEEVDSTLRRLPNGLPLHKIWRSKVHGDGKPAYEGWFIMGIGKEKGEQISYHIPLARWDETNFAETLDRAPEWDGHRSPDVLERLKAL